MTSASPTAARPRTAEPSFGRAILAAALSALAVALVAHAANAVAFFVGGGNTTQILFAISEYFFLSTVFTFVMLMAFAALGALRRWYLALIAGLVSSLVGTVLATTLSITSSGQPLNSEAIAFIGGSILSINLILILAFTVAAASIGRHVWRFVLGFRAPDDARSHTALVRIPATNLAEGLLTHIDRESIDLQRADEQWERYVAALEANGWTTREVPSAEDLPDSVFVEDAVVLFGDTAILTSPGALSRRGETAGVEESVRELGFTLESIELPGTLDGGDVLKVGDTVYVGRSGRTNAEGIQQLRSLIAPLGYRVVPVPVTRTLHLKSQVTALPDGTVIGFPDNVDNAALFDRFLAVPEAHGASVVVLDHETVLISEAAPETAERLRDLGYRVVTVDISEFEKLEGSVTCLSVRLR